jgi:hypothetical protein
VKPPQHQQISSSAPVVSSKQNPWMLLVVGDDAARVAQGVERPFVLPLMAADRDGGIRCGGDAGSGGSVARRD